jgi:hypothetical protein
VAFPYPALTALVFVPLALLPQVMADGLDTVTLLAAAVLALRILNVRDWRITGLALLWGPVAAAWQSANLTLVLVLGLACLWRVRDRPLVAGALLAILVSLKPFVWPVAVWLVATRRWRAAAAAAASGLAINLIAWAVVGFDQLRAYRHVVQDVTSAMEHRGYSPVNLALHLGLGRTGAYLLTAVAVLTVLAGCVVFGRRLHESQSLTLSIAAALLATPVLWTHYFALLIVPLAVTRPRLSVLWVLPVVFWVCPSTAPATWQISLALLLAALIITRVVWRPHAPTRMRLGLARRAGYAAAGASP